MRATSPSRPFRERRDRRPPISSIRTPGDPAGRINGASACSARSSGIWWWTSATGNRGIWWPTSGPTTPVNYNALTAQDLSNYGLDITNAADRAILSAPIGSAAAGRFQNKLPYSNFPLTATVAQSLRPFPQFTVAPQALWAPLGDTWYNSLQVKVTKRFSHGLDFAYNFTWAQELNNGVEADSAGPFGAAPQINDVFNRAQNKVPLGLLQAVG